MDWPKTSSTLLATQIDCSKSSKSRNAFWISFSCPFKPTQRYPEPQSRNMPCLLLRRWRPGHRNFRGFPLSCFPGVDLPKTRDPPKKSLLFKGPPQKWLRNSFNNQPKRGTIEKTYPFNCTHCSLLPECIRQQSVNSGLPPEWSSCKV